MTKSSPQIGGLDRDSYDRAAGEYTEMGRHLEDGAVRSLAAEVVSRLAARHNGKASPEQCDLDTLCAALTDPDPEVGRDAVTALLDKGVTREQLYLDYLAGAARRLGEWWSEDRTSFATVSIGASRIYAILRTLRAGLAPDNGGDRQEALFASVPGEAHFLGVTMAADLARQAGWRITLRLGDDHDTLVRAVQDSGCRVVGLSASAGRSLTSLSRLVAALRVTCPSTSILVSGHVLCVAPEDVAALGVDACVTDVAGALRALETLDAVGATPSA